jgi:polar amino acid transport system substrate-binding protein
MNWLILLGSQVNLRLKYYSIFLIKILITMKKLSLIIVAFMSLLLSGCFSEQDEDTWIVGTSADNPPYEFMKDGKIVGFDIDLITEIGKHLGKQVKFKNMEFHSLLAAISSNNVDLVTAGLSITKERTARVDFSIPYASATVAVLYRREDAFKKHQDLENKNVGAQLGTIWSLIAHDLAAKSQFRFKALSSNLMLVEELKTKRIDAIIMESFQADKFLEANPAFAHFNLEEFSSSFSIAMPKNSPLKKNIDHAIKALKSNGTIHALSKKWGLVSAD